MRKFNKEFILRIIILISFTLFYLMIVINGKVVLYVHPRIKPFIMFAIIAMPIIAFFLIKEAHNNRRNKVKVYSYGICLIPIILGAFINFVDFNSTTAKNAEISRPKVSEGFSDNSDSYKIQGKDSNEVTKFEDDVIKITTKNFVSCLDEILRNPSKYANKNIEIEGFVYKDDTLLGNEFVVGKFMMACCAADTQVVGILAKYDDVRNFENDTWIKVKGKLVTGVYSGGQEIIINVESMERDNNPDKSYVYP